MKLVNILHKCINSINREITTIGINHANRAVRMYPYVSRVQVSMTEEYRDAQRRLENARQDFTDISDRLIILEQLEKYIDGEEMTLDKALECEELLDKYIREDM